MTAIPVAFRSNSGKYNFEGTTALINAYAEQRGADAKAPYTALPCDGTVSFSAVTDTPCRGAIYLDDLNVSYSIHSGSAWKITSAGVATNVGTIPGIDRVQIVRNQKATPQIVVRCDAGVYKIESDAVTLISDADLPDVVSITYVGGYVVYGIADGRFFISGINEVTTIDATDYATAEQSADKLRRLYALGGELFIMGSNTIEPWVNSGQADFPFELRSAASVVQKGIMAPESVAPFDNTFCFVGEDGIVYRYSSPPMRISNHEVERLIKEDDDQEGIAAQSWSRGGHTFYCLTGSDWSRCYDAATKEWHTRESYQDTRWRHDHAFAAWGKTLVGDRIGGSLYYLDSNTYTEAGGTFIYGVDMPTMHAFPNGGVVDALHLDLVTGVGQASSTVDANVMVSKSTDGGNTYDFTRTLPLGRLGGQARRVTTRRLGRFGPRGCVWRIRISDVTGRALALVDAAVRPLKR
jgi:hypothetical protein